MTQDYNIKTEFNEDYRYSRDYWAPFVKDAQVYTLAASGYTWSNEERRELIRQGREPLEYNIMRRPLEFFSGFLRDNINQIIYSPVEGSDQKTADQFTKLSYYDWDKGKGYPVFLSACDETFKSGISLCGIQMDYSRDFINGDASFYMRTYNSFYLDPTFSNLDLSDCGFAIMRDLLGKQSIKQLVPFIDPKIIDELYMGYRDDKFMQFHPEFNTFSRNRNLIAYDQYYKRRTRKRQFLVDMGNSFHRDITDLSKAEKDRLKFGINRFDVLRENADFEGINPDEIPNIEIRTVERPYVELNIMLNGEQLYCGEDKTGIVHTYPFAPIIAYFEPSIWMPSQRIQGLASTNYSLQRQFNMRHMKITDMMDSEISTGFKYLLGTVPDPQEMQQSGQNRIIGVDPEGNPLGLDAVQQLHGGNANPTIIEYSKTLDQLSLTLSNVTESVLGIDEKGNMQISGRLAEVRIAQGLRGNRKIFDNIETAQQILGGLLMHVWQNNYPVGKIERILGEKPTQQFYDQQWEQYDAVIKEGVRSKSQRDAYYYELVNLKKDGIVDVPQAEIVRALSMAGLSDLEEAIEAQDKMVAEQQAKLAELEQIKMQKDISTIDANNALAGVRRAREVGEYALGEERVSEAAENRAQAALARSKTITEIAQMEDERILRVLEFVNQLEMQEAADQEAVSQKVQAKADETNVNTGAMQTGQTRQMQSQENQMSNSIMQDFNQGG